MLLAWAMRVVVENHRVENNHVEVVNIKGFDWLNRSELKSNKQYVDWATRPCRQPLPHIRLLLSASSSHLVVP
jgi:hypothetical protein